MILDRYLALRFLRSFAATLAIFFGFLALVDLVEKARRFGDEAEGLGPILALTLLDVPSGLYAILPLVTIIAAISLFLGLARSSELVVTRASGRSAIRALLGPSVVAVALGAAAVAAFNPIVAVTSREYEAREARLEGDESVLAFSEDGLWLRQGGQQGPVVIRAARSNLDGTVLSDVTFLSYGEDGRPRERVEAATARLAQGHWVLSEDQTLAPPTPKPSRGRSPPCPSRPPSPPTRSATASAIRPPFRSGSCPPSSASSRRRASRPSATGSSSRWSSPSPRSSLPCS